ncbi:MarR family winged helix-turn-helix transcriptional regulator [Clostridium lacusfryxellense]|uniref:MarR family winged helix-turn-helix transcriptional regulator n=1 Tax=Clostridium lacusfryxellense TaxID=205328 RepID=UPI001C0CB657|nr:MarR family transcriptional regulator [Clostridium lacusfryxellense]MBU3111251.1 MarR family transcriptional regulator [Clostridium lacusfryxellense]
MNENKNSLGRWISLLHRYGHVYIGRQLKQYNISKGQYTFLNALYKKDGLRQEQLSDYLKIDKGTTAKAIKKLEDDEYITRKVDEKDKRAYNVYLTQKALIIKPVVRKAMMNWTDILFSGFSEDEKKTSLALLERMGENATSITQNYFSDDSAH